MMKHVLVAGSGGGGRPSMSHCSCGWFGPHDQFNFHYDQRDDVTYDLHLARAMERLIQANVAVVAAKRELDYLLVNPPQQKLLDRFLSEEIGA